jgi:cation diffusion facilitator family transporter
MLSHVHGGIVPASDPILDANRQASRAVLLSFAGLCATSALQAAAAWYSGSVALMADTLHNMGDAATAVPLWIAFRYARRRPDGRFTYGYGRMEDLAGVLVVLVILASAIAAGVESVRRFASPAKVEHLWAASIAAAAGFIGNEAVAAYRIRVGNAIGSAALVADGRHARADGLTSLAVLGGTGLVAAGIPIADPAIGLLICALILKIAWNAGKEVFLRLLDGVDPRVGDEIRETVRALSEVGEVTEVRVRWSGHRMYADVNLAVGGSLTVGEGHDIAAEARHRLLHRLPYLSDATVHVDPAGVSGASRHGVSHHQHDGLPGHSH